MVENHMLFNQPEIPPEDENKEDRAYDEFRERDNLVKFHVKVEVMEEEDSDS